MMALIDEIFKGTNSADRIVGATAAVKRLSSAWCLTLVSTHDFELCALESDPVIRARNFHFEESYQGDRICFDYRIKDGRCRRQMQGICCGWLEFYRTSRDRRGTG